MCTDIFALQPSLILLSHSKCLETSVHVAAAHLDHQHPSSCHDRQWPDASDCDSANPDPDSYDQDQDNSICFEDCPGDVRMTPSSRIFTRALIDCQIGTL